MVIVCHIAGANSEIKEWMKKELDSAGILTLDLDRISVKKYTDDALHKFQEQREWKDKLDKEIKQLNDTNSDKKIVLFGLYTHPKNHRIKADIMTNNKFLVKIDAIDNSKMIVKHNIDKHRDKIIEGTFPLQYIDHNHLMKQREKFLKIYENLGYKSMLKEDILSTILKDRQLAYVGTRVKYDDKIQINKKSMFGKSKYIIGYPYKWLSIVSAIPNINDAIEKGFVKEDDIIKPYIKEKYEGAFDKLRMPIYLYTTNIGEYNKEDKYKSKSDKPISYIKVDEIPNAYEFIKDEDVIIVKY